MLKPVTLPCGHSGCLQCLTTLLEYQESKGSSSAPCPKCRTHKFQRNHLTVSCALNTLTSDLDVRCTNRNCTWSGKFPEAQSHDKLCLYRQESCPNNCCPVTMERREVEAHLVLCKKQAVPCPDCKKPIARDEMVNHATSGCMYSGIPCPLGCGLNLLW